MRGSARTLNVSVATGFPRHIHPHFVRAGRYLRAGDTGSPENHSRKARRVGIAHVPEERVHAFAIRRARRRWWCEAVVAGGSGRTRGRIGLARIAANDLARRIEEVEIDLLVRGAEPVLDDDALRRILSGRMNRRVLRCHCAAATAATEAAEAAAARETILIARLEEMRGARLHRVVHLLERRDVVHDVEAAAVRRDDQIALLEREIVHRHERQVETQRLPVRAVIRREPHAALRAGDEQPALAPDLRARRA